MACKDLFKFSLRHFVCASPWGPMRVAAADSWNTARRAWAGAGHCACETDTGGLPQTCSTGEELAVCGETSKSHYHLSPWDFIAILGVMQCGCLFMISNRGHHPMGHYVPAELEDRVGHEEIQLQLTILLKSKANSQYFSSGGPVVCDFTMETLSWTKLSTHRRVHRSPALNLKVHI